MKKLLLSSLCAAALAFAAVSHAGDGKPNRHHHYFAEKLGLSEEQRNEMRALHESTERRHRGAMHAQMKKLMALDPLSPSYDEEVSALAEQAAEQARQAVHAKAEKHAKVYAILTPEQREQAKTLHAEMQEKRRERKDKGHHHYSH